MLYGKQCDNLLRSLSYLDSSDSKFLCESVVVRGVDNIQLQSVHSKIGKKVII